MVNITPTIPLLPLLVLLFILTTLATAFERRHKCPTYVYEVTTGTGHSASDLRPTIEAFKARLGGRDNRNHPATSGEGFRTISWDTPHIPYKLPSNFFNTRIPRGAIFRSLKDAFAVSNPPHKFGIRDDRFSSIVPKFIAQMFQRFSGKRLFSPVKANTFATKFQLPGKRHKAFVRGFGGVFVDVDKKKETFVKLIDRHGCVIANVEVPVRPQGLSFVGVIVYDVWHKFQIPVVEKVVVKLGGISLVQVAKFFHGWNHKKYVQRKAARDVVVMDDILYGEPVFKGKEVYEYGYYGYHEQKKYQKYVHKFMKKHPKKERKVQRKQKKGRKVKRHEKKHGNKYMRKDEKKHDRKVMKRNDKKHYNKHEKKHGKKHDCKW